MKLSTHCVSWTVFGLVSLISLSVAADPGEGINLGSFLLSPYINLNVTRDSNVYKSSDNEIADTFAEPELGLQFSSSSETNLLSLRGNLYYAQRKYFSEDALDFNPFGDNIALRLGDGRRALLELIQSYRKLADIERHVADIEPSSMSFEMVEDVHTLTAERGVNQLGASALGRMTDKLELALSYRYSGVAYEEDRFLDLDGHLLQFEGALGLTDKTDAFLTLRQGLQYQEGTDGNADLTTARLGLKTQGSEKLVYRAAAGLERYARPAELEDDANLSFNFAVSADWFITEKVTFRLGGFNGTQFSSFYEGNGLEYISGWAGLGYRWKPSTTFSVRAVYRTDDYLDPVENQFDGQMVDRFDKRFEGHARVDYLLPRGFLRLFLEATYDEVDSNIDYEDYVDARFVLGANVRY
jgi:hypothetical protein